MPKKRKAPETFNEFLGAEVAAHLTKRGKGQDDLVDDLGWKSSTVGRKLRGETALSVQELLEVARYLEIDAAKIVDVAVADFDSYQRQLSAASGSNVTQLRPKKVTEMTVEEIESITDKAAHSDPDANEDEHFD